jgi:hypothetical protein
MNAERATMNEPTKNEERVPVDRMSEAEVSLRLAFWLIRKGHVSDDIFVAVDGA